MPMPNDKAAVCHLLSMINYLAPHIPNIASICTPLRDLLKTDVLFQWDAPAQNVLEQIKDTLSSEIF